MAAPARNGAVKFRIVQLALALDLVLMVKHTIIMLLLPRLSAQVRQTGIIVALPLQIYANGHCAALRLRDMLSLDSTVLALTSLEEMCYTSLIIPWQHVVPVV